MKDATFINRVVLRDYKSIAACDVQLGPLMFLVGPNGAGKSNFLDALHLVSDALRVSLNYALQERGGFDALRRRSAPPSNSFGLRLEFTLASGETGHYAFLIEGEAGRGYTVRQEECIFSGPDDTRQKQYYVVQGEHVESSALVTPAVSKDRLYLVVASGLQEFRPVYEALSHMGFYNLNPDKIRDLQPPDTGDLLLQDGSNLGSVLAQLADHQPAMKARIEAYLSKIVPGVIGVDAKTIGPKETLEFSQVMAGAPASGQFLAASMSDGTLRALGILVALFQSRNGIGPRVPLVGIEEPEVALHPAAAGILLDSLREASQYTQVLVTTHSPDLLEDQHLAVDTILAVTVGEQGTQIAPVDETGRSVLRDQLYTPGELLRLNQLMPDPMATESISHKHLRLFDLGQQDSLDNGIA